MTESREHIDALALEAAEWHLDLQAGEFSPERRTAFVQWLCRSPLHVAEFLRVAALQADLGNLPQFSNLDVGKLLAETAAGVPGENVIDFPLKARDAAPAVPVAPQRARARRAPRLRVAMGVAAGAAIVAACLPWSGTVRKLWTERHYTTGTGEQRSLRLQDGSDVQINVRSELAVDVDGGSRDIRLENGEALFQVAKDPAHPFRVHTPQAVVEAKGTRFDVQVRDGKTVVVLLEGHVEVSPPAPDDTAVGRAGRSARAPRNPAVMLDPGEAVTVDADDTSAALHPRAADVAAATAWLQGRLVFDDAPLSKVVEEFDRYSTEQVVIDDAAVGDIRVTASFDAGNAQMFARSVAAAAALRVSHEPDGSWHIGHP